jgi:flagellar M-ring protein FliF
MGGVLKKLTDLDPKKKILIISSIVAVIIIGAAFHLSAVASKPVPLFTSNIDPGDASEIQQRLAQWGISYQMEAGGTNVLVAPQMKHRALLQLAQEGLPRRQVVGTNNMLSSKSQGMVPDTKEDKERKMVMALEGDMTIAIRQIKGVADAYVKIVPKPKDNWGDEKSSATAAVMLRLYPGTKLSGQQIDGIVHLVSSSVAGLDPTNVKVMDTNGRILNNKPGGESMAMGGDGEGYTDQYDMKTKNIEKELTSKVQTALDKFLGPGRAQVALSVEMDFSQVEQEMTKLGGPGNVSGTVITGKSEDSETFNSGAGESGKDGVAELSGTAGEKNDYKKSRVTVRYRHDERKIRKVDVAPRIKRLTCSVMVDGVKDPEMVGRIKDFAKNAIGFDPSRGDEVSVVPFVMTRSAMLEEMANRASGGSNFFPTDPASQKSTASMPAWMPAALAIPLVLMILLVALFYMKQKNVQKEKQRLVLTTGPGATVSDISDLLADKEGKVTPPPATKVNTGDQLEKLAKEKPTKVAELLKSTWLADR